MGLAVKAAGVALVSCVCMVLIKKHAPEHALLMGITAAVVLCLSVIPAAGEVMELWRQLQSSAALSGAVAAPVAKCVGLGLITRLTSDLCRDSGSAAIASAVEIVGCVCALLAAGPLMTMLLEMVGGGV